MLKLNKSNLLQLLKECVIITLGGLLMEKEKTVKRVPINNYMDYLLEYSKRVSNQYKERIAKQLEQDNKKVCAEIKTK
jgi:hypothetical protein